VNWHALEVLEVVAAAVVGGILVSRHKQHTRQWTVGVALVAFAVAVVVRILVA